ncbi:MAG TPA: glycosyltransferase, partial [Anaerolineae bacterium]|nr:glycosyltransferase [Anaerolineae bacterium]
MTKVSIITPSYNQAKYLEQTIQSVLNQNYSEIEYILIDGGSNDGSINIIKKYQDKFAFWISEKDNGQADAINKGFAKATGDIVAWLNSDDYYLPETIAKVVKVFEANPDVV